jgi:uncharacterized membrane protein YesL
MRLYDAADEVVWAVKLHLLWMLFTLAGGVVLGVGPATVAAYTLSRRHIQGDSFPVWPAFAATYRREFGRGAILVLPLLGAAVLLVTNYFYFAAMGSVATVPRLATVAALAVLVVVAAYLLPMAVHYDLRPHVYLTRASLFAISRPAPSVLLLLVFAAIVYAVASYPFLGLIIAAGGWIQLDTWLCLRFFAENDMRLRAKGIS